MSKLAVVTGAARGMGLEWCRQLALRGDTVVLTARSRERADGAAQVLRAEGLDIVALELDAADEGSIARLAEAIAARFGRVDLLVNNAGVNPKDWGEERFAKSFRLDQLDPDEVTGCIRTNGVMPVIVVKHLLPLLKRAERPVVVSISSWLGSIGAKTTPGHYGYATSKAALNMMNKAMALELREHGVIAVVLNPGWVQTDMGGQKAKLTAAQAVRGMLGRVVDEVTLEDTGKFLQWDGTEHVW